eukprot:13981436-Alexandrium_andersonii.AAC.1
MAHNVLFDLRTPVVLPIPCIRSCARRHAGLLAGLSWRGRVPALATTGLLHVSLAPCGVQCLLHMGNKAYSYDGAAVPRKGSAQGSA